MSRACNLKQASEDAQGRYGAADSGTNFDGSSAAERQRGRAW
ncbi:hypothetical protein [Cobetia sp. ICG0124]|nr:hypothetical protein [Cobetia sp. ICG0124]